MKLGIREVTIVLVVLGVLAGAYFLGFARMQSQRAFLLNDIEKKQNTLEQLRKANASAAQIEKQLQRLAATMDYFDSRLPQEREVEQILREAWMLAESTGLTTNTVKPQKTVKGGGANEQPIEIDFKGNYPGFYDFLCRLERLDRITQLRKLELRKMDSLTNEMSAKLTLSIFYEPDAVAPAK